MKTRRPDIQRAAYDILGTQGLESLHSRTVGAALGVNHATIHYYFPHRIDLLVGIADFAVEQFRRDREKFHQGLSKPGDKLEAELSLAEAYCKKSSRFIKVIAGLYAASVEDKDLRLKVQALYKEWNGLIEDLAAKSSIKKNSPYKNGELLTATLFGLGLASHLMDGKIGAKEKLDDVYTSLFG